MLSAPKIDLTGHIALVTGAANGLGEGSAMALARCGAKVVVVDRDRENGARVTAAIQAMAVESLFIEADLMKVETISLVADEAARRFGQVSILVNNVGGGRPTAFLEQSANSIQRHIALNLMSTLLMTQAIAPLMIKAGGGALINVASTEALRAAPGFAVYAACKAAVVSFTRTMALELAAHQIRSFALAPDMIETPGLAPLMNAATASQKAARDRYVPLGRIGTAQEFGNVVAFLASGMASYLNGITVPVDAGATAASGWYRAPDNQWCLYHE